MSKPKPTAYIFGEPDDPTTFFKQLKDAGIEYSMSSGGARDPVFTFYEDIAQGDFMIAFPNAHPVHLATLIAEGEVGHPLIVQETPSKDKGKSHFNLKPIIYFGAEAEWRPFKAQFNGMRKGGLLRDGFDRVVHYSESFDDMLSHLNERLIREIPSTRVHYYHHNKTPSDITVKVKDDMRPPSDVTVSFFGSASVKNKGVEKRSDEHAKICSRNDWNILHGGGDAGVMGWLSEYGQKCKAFVFGISVDFSGAPKIFFERSGDEHHLDNHDYFVASKDMIHRIETYALHSNAFVALDGGIGTFQEVLILAELLSVRHPSVMYQTATGEIVPKPLHVQNESGIFTEALKYLEDRGLTDLREQIQVANSSRELENDLRAYFREHRPIPREDRNDLRAQAYHPEIKTPQWDISSLLDSFSDISTPNIDLPVDPMGKRTGQRKELRP